MNSTGFYQPRSLWNDLNICMSCSIESVDFPCVSPLSLRHQTITRPNLGLKEKAQISKGALWSSFPLLGGSVRTHCCWPRQVTTLTCLTLQPLSPLTTHCDFLPNDTALSQTHVIKTDSSQTHARLLGTWGSVGSIRQWLHNVWSQHALPIEILAKDGMWLQHLCQLYYPNHRVSSHLLPHG